MAKAYRVVSRFYCRETGGYIDVGMPVPAELPPDAAEALVRKGCLVPDAGAQAATGGAPAASGPAAPPASPKAATGAPARPRGGRRAGREAQ